MKGPDSCLKKTILAAGWSVARMEVRTGAWSLVTETVQRVERKLNHPYKLYYRWLEKVKHGWTVQARGNKAYDHSLL